jgi:N-acyl-D-amino-acid deacylase
MPPADDVVIRDGSVVDGCGGEPFVADVLIQDGRITAVGEVPRNQSMVELRASDCLVAPGFIDIHSHSDHTLLADARAVTAVHQGVTLEVIGNCGHGCFPIRDEQLARNAIYGYSEAVPLTWSDAAGYLARLEDARPAVNVATLVPNGQLRLATVGMQDTPADDPALGRMKRELEEALDAGAWGFSTGLEYAAEAGAPDTEIAELCKIVAHRGGLYATHTRRRDAGAASAVEDAVRTAEETGVRLQVSHLLPRSGLDEGRRCIEVVANAAMRGLDVAFDMHTRLYGYTYLAAVLPPWALQNGQSGLRKLLDDSGRRQEMKAHQSILSAGGNWERVVLLDNQVCPQFAGMTIAAIAAERDQDPFDAIYDLLYEGFEEMHHMMVMILCYTEEQQQEVFQHELCMPGSDATTLAPDGVLGASVFAGAYTWAAWYFRYMVRETHILSPAEAVQRLTTLPAARLGLRDRGVIRVGAPADIAVFDPREFGERGTPFEPNQLAVGMKHVLVNGVLTLENGVLSGARGGKILRPGA